LRRAAAQPAVPRARRRPAGWTLLKARLSITEIRFEVKYFDLKSCIFAGPETFGSPDGSPRLPVRRHGPARARPARITAANADISASGLRSADLAAVIASGHLSASFTTAPCQVSITLAAAQATLRLPDGAPYRVTQQVTSGYVREAIPQAGSASRTVTARIDSGELELLPA
jgi:hypothetical protein